MIRNCLIILLLNLIEKVGEFIRADIILQFVGLKKVVSH